MNVVDFFKAWGCGNLTLKPFYVTASGVHEPKSTSWQAGNGTAKMSCEYEDGSRDELYFTIGENHVTCRRSYSLGAVAKDIVELGLNIDGAKFNGAPERDYFYHNENPRIYEKMAIPVDYDRVNSGDVKDTGFDAQAGNRWADPGVVCERIGRSPYQPFPAIYVGNYDENRGLVHGTLSQRLFYHNYELRHSDGALMWSIFSSFKDIAARKCAAGETLVDEWYLGVTEDGDDLEYLFAGYTAELRKHLPPLYGATQINRDNMVWGSWNDGIFRDISEEMLLKETRFLKEHFPMVRWIQVDDGYATNAANIAHGLGMPYEGEAGVDPNKFPNGLRHFTDAVKLIGLRPAVWIGGFCPKFTPIYQDHPEWFINYDYRTPRSSPLDVSQPEVREYMTKALDTFFKEYGFEGMKHDFWSYAFEDSHDLYKYNDASGYEWRAWWLNEVRKRLAQDAYFQTGCDIVMGNPFLGEKFTNYRYGIDIGSGNWDYVKINFLWGVACFATHTSDLFVANSDSVGLFPGLNDTEALFCLNYCLATHSMVEIAGKLSEADPESPRFKMLKKTVCNPNNGQEIFLADYDYRDPNKQIPRIIYFNTPHFSTAEGAAGLPVRTAGLFNIEEEPITVTLTPEKLNLPAGEYLVTDVWSNKTEALGDGKEFTIEPHGSRLLAISLADECQLLDANMRIIPQDYLLEFTYPGQAELFLNFKPKTLLFDDQEIPFQCTEGDGNYRVTFDVPQAGMLNFIA